MLLLACGPDEELVAERDGLLDEVATQDERIATLEAENGVLAARADRLAVEVDSLRTQLAIERLGTDPIPVRFETNQGTIRCTLLPAEAPQTVLNFVDLAQGRREWVDPDTGRPTSRRFYDGLTFHRVMPGFMIQGGDPLGTGMGGPGYKFKDEITDRTFEKPGMLAMANSGPDTNGSQFFITEGTPVKLNGKHTIFGTCKDADVVKAIARVPTDSQNKPTSPVVIQKVVF